MIRHIMFCGVGGTGKSSVAQALKDTHHVPGSITRDAYAKYGIKDQKAGDAMKVAERLTFQSWLYGYYLGRVRELLDDQPKPIKPLLLERSPIDHLAYRGLIAEPKDWQFHQALDLIYQLNAIIFFFPYPTPWGGQDDGFRNVNAEQDFKLNALMLDYLNRLEVPYTTLSDFNLDARISLVKHYGADHHV